LGDSVIPSGDLRSKKPIAGSAVETVAADGNRKSVAFGSFFLMISTSCLEKPPQNPLRLSHSYHSAGGGTHHI